MTQKSSTPSDPSKTLQPTRAPSSEQHLSRTVSGEGQRPEALPLQHGRGDPLTPSVIMAMQRTIGNQAVQRLLAHAPQRPSARRESPLTIQRKGGHIRSEEVPKDPNYDSNNRDLGYRFTGYPELLAKIQAYIEEKGTDYNQQLALLSDIESERKKCKSLLPKSELFDPVRAFVEGLAEKLPQESEEVRKQAYDYALETHEKDRAFLLESTREGLSEDKDRRLRNSAEWVLKGTRTKLYAVTPTGDSWVRVKKAERSPEKDEAFFPAAGAGSPGAITDTAADYKYQNLDDNTNLRFTTKNTLGWQTPGAIAIPNPLRQGKEKIWQVLRHEVQHDADRHMDRDSSEGVYEALREQEEFKNTQVIDLEKPLSEMNAGFMDIRVSLKVIKTGETIKFPNLAEWNAAMEKKYGPEAVPTEEILLNEFKTYLENPELWKPHPVTDDRVAHEKNLQGYKTEYRAYSYEGKEEYDSLSNDEGKDRLAPKQKAISDHIHQGYEHTKKGWYDSNHGAKFRDAVRDYRDPDAEGFNKYNSLRVNRFYEALDALGTKKPATFADEKTQIDIAPVETPVAAIPVNDDRWDELQSAIDALNPEDAQSILEESPAMIGKIKKHLDGEAQQAVLEKLAKQSGTQ